MSKRRKKIAAVFYKAASGTEPVRDWLRSLSKDDRLKIGRTNAQRLFKLKD